MKKIFPPVLLLFTLIMTACGSAQVNPTQASDDVPVATMLVIGTLQLEGTQQAVTDEQAGELLPMWQVYQSLTNSSTAAQAEIDGLVEQIRETMTSANGGHCGDELDSTRYLCSHAGAGGRQGTSSAEQQWKQFHTKRRWIYPARWRYGWRRPT